MSTIYVQSITKYCLRIRPSYVTISPQSALRHLNVQLERDFTRLERSVPLRLCPRRVSFSPATCAPISAHTWQFARTEEVVSADLPLPRPLLYRGNITLQSRLSQFEHDTPVTDRSADRPLRTCASTKCLVFIVLLCSLLSLRDPVQASYVRGKETTCTRPTARLYLARRADYIRKKSRGSGDAD